MPEPTPPSPTSSPTPSNEPQQTPMSFNIGEEFGTASKNLPSAKIVLIVLACIVVIAVVVSLVERPHVTATGAIDDVVAVEIPFQNSVMVAINVSFQNNGKKPFWIHDIKVEMDTGTNKHSDPAASAVDFDRYFQAFPALKEHALDPLKRESMIEPGNNTKGTIIVSFPVTPDVFASRKSLTVTILPYDQPLPLVLTK
jgi:hypothetical protein